MGNRTRIFDRDYTPAWAVESTFVTATQGTFASVCCAYCGELALEREHLVPYKWIRTLISPRDLHMGEYWTWILPSCVECNRIAHDQVFPSAVQKRWYIQAQLRARYDNILVAEHWNEDELDDLGWGLRQYVGTKQAQADTIRLRISYHGPLPDDLGSASLTERIRSSIVSDQGFQDA